MNIASVCLRCRQSAISPHFQARSAGFVSLGALIKQGADNNKSSDIESTRKADNGLLQSASPQQHSASADKLLQTLFSSRLGELPKPLMTRYSRLNLDVRKKDSEYCGAVQSPPYPFEKQHLVLKRMLQKGNLSLKDLWTQTENILKLMPAESHAPRAQKGLLLVQQSLADILLLICRCRSLDLSSLKIPAAPKIIKLYLTHKIMLSNWDDILWIKIEALLEAVHQFPKAATGFDPYDATRLLEEILDIWEMFMEEYGTTDHSVRTQPPKSESFDQPGNIAGSVATSSHRTRTWRGLPNNLDTRLPSLSARSAIRQRFLQFLPKYPNRPMNGIAEAALLTHDCIDILKTNSVISDSVIKSAQPFHNFIRFLNYKGYHLIGLVIDLLKTKGLSPRIADLAIASWEAPPKSKVERLVSVGRPTSVLKKQVFQQSKEWKMQQIRTISQDLARALQRSDTGLATKLWQRFYDDSIHDGVVESSQDQILSQFITAFFSLRRPEQAVNVWNAMVRWNLTPKQKHWQAMIVGSTKAKDLTSVQRIWSNMKAAGFEPDTKSWTAWIHGLIKCGEWQIGLAALEELGRLWRQVPEKAKTDDAGQLLPTIEPVNGAITALLATGKADLVPKVFRWAKSQNLTLNTSTFNIMLRPAIRKDRIDDVYHLLSEMQIHNCQPDIVTFTIILNGLLSNPTSSFHTQTPEAQQSTVLNLLSTLQNNGLTATAHTYSTVLDGLLSPQTLNLSASRAVLDHMAGSNLKPSPHIYTILVSHYFDTSPPNLAAIDSLLHRIRQEKGVLDPVFYDRMIEGYARIGEVEKMLQFVRRAPNEGKSPSWMALLAVLKELVRQQEWVFVKEFVADVSDQKNGLLRHGEGSKVGRDWFWELVDDLRGGGFVTEEERESREC